MSYTVIERSMSCAPSSDSLSQKTVEKSVRSLDWNILRVHLEEIGLTPQIFETLIGHLRRSSGLIMERTDAKREAERSAFFLSLKSYVKSHLGISESDELAKEIDLLKRLEAGYRSILTCLGRTDIAKKPADVRISACVYRAAQQNSHVVNKIKRAMEQRATSGQPITHSILLTEDEFQFAPDNVAGNLVELLTSTVLMEAYNNNWFDNDKYVVLPKLCPADEQTIYQAGSVEMLAQAWHMWRNTEEEMRYWGGKLEYFDADDLPKQLLVRDIQLTTYCPSDDQLFDYAANVRLKDFSEQIFAKLLFETPAISNCVGIQNNARLLPHSFVTLSEAHAAASLSSSLGYTVTTDTDEPGGLRLVEWLRGYAVLEQLAHDQQKEATSNTSQIVNIKRDELLLILERCGLARNKASVFISNATFCSKSRDLYDCPLIKLEDNSFILFAPAVTATNWTTVVLSNIARLREPLSKKGKAFENRILQLLKSKGLKAHTLTFTRDNAEYQYDVLLDWDKYLFIFECKNHSLSNNDPIAAYFFDREIESSCKQVLRQRDALFRYPDVIRDKLGIDISTKQVIPCVLNSLPYSLPGEFDGVYVTDACALARFFEERYLHIKEPIKLDAKASVIHRAAVYSLWASDKPSPSDLLRQLEEPIQLKVVFAHLDVFPVVTRLDEKWVAMKTGYQQKEKTIKSMSEVFGVSSSVVNQTLETVREKLREVKSRIDMAKTQIPVSTSTKH